MKTIDAQMVAKMFLGGAKNLESKKEWINELNVFPVPDGDTGTNMTLTITAAAGEVGNLEELNMETLAKCISSGSLRGARGNSGVILSQLLRGFTKGIKDQEELDVIDLANAMQKAVETAYKAVMKPKEGTILTVAKGAALKAAELAQSMEDMEEFCRLVIEEAQEVLSRTPDMLPVLKEAGVVDSGGQGLVEVLKGCYDGQRRRSVLDTVRNLSSCWRKCMMKRRNWSLRHFWSLSEIRSWWCQMTISSRCTYIRTIPDLPSRERLRMVPCPV